MDSSLRYDIQEGSFGRTLTQEQLFDLFWPDADGEGIPWTLFWDGYTLTADAIYDKEGSLLWVTVTGSKGDAHFSLQLAPEQLPPPVWPDRNLPTTTTLVQRSLPGPPPVTGTMTAILRQR